MDDLQSDNESFVVFCIMSLGAAQLSEQIDITHIDIVAEIVSAYVSNNSVPYSDVPALIASVNSTVLSLSNSFDEHSEVKPRKLTPTEVRKSIKPDYIVSFLDGKKYKSLKRHLTTRGYTPDSYREAYGLPDDYAMVAREYSAQRSALAKEIGLGAIRSDTAATSPKADKVPGKRGRPRKELNVVKERKITPYTRAEQTREADKSNEGEAAAA